MNILIISKSSKYEWERKILNLSHDELISKYNKERANLDAILKAYDKQLHVRETFKRVFPNITFRMMHEITEPIADYDMTIVLGGDNSFTNISHYVGDIPILGINSDPEHSTGCLLRYIIKEDEDIFNLTEILDFQHYTVEEWTRLEATIDGNLITPAISEYFFGERLRKNMSRHVLVYHDKEYEQKCSGMIISTGAGSTGWIHSASEIPLWKPTDKSAVFLITEPYQLNKDTLIAGEILPGEDIVLYSLNDSEGYASADSWEEFEFTRGSEARIHLGTPLNVVVPKL